jgi:hypothetical protein
MIIDSTFPDHWKVRELKRVSGHAEAMEWIIRLWVGCAVRKSFCFEASAHAEIPAICNYDDNPGEFVDWLLKVKILDREDTQLVAHGFEERNPQLVANWNNGKKGGRPKTQSAIGLTQSENGFNNIKPVGKGRVEKGKEENNNEHASRAATDVAFSFSKETNGAKTSKGRKQLGVFEPPTLEIFINYGISKGISEQDCRDLFEIWETGAWKDGNNIPIQNWKQKLLTFQKIGNLPSDKKANINRGKQNDSGGGRPHLL